MKIRKAISLLSLRGILCFEPPEADRIRQYKNITIVEGRDVQKPVRTAAIADLQCSGGLNGQLAHKEETQPHKAQHSTAPQRENKETLFVFCFSDKYLVLCKHPSFTY